jgi:hypothetical protein
VAKALPKTRAEAVEALQHRLRWCLWIEHVYLAPIEDPFFGIPENAIVVFYSGCQLRIPKIIDIDGPDGFEHVPVEIRRMPHFSAGAITREELHQEKLELRRYLEEIDAQKDTVAVPVNEQRSCGPVPRDDDRTRVSP